jgi:acyl-CoA reductase-like NAD-dependent aldehyde dehydrogenase
MMKEWVVRAQTLQIEVRDFIDGCYSPASASDGLRLKLCPRDGRILYGVPEEHPQAVERAIASARRAHAEGRWAGRSAQERKETLQRLATAIEKHRDELALLESLDVGKPIADALGTDIPMAAATVRFCAEAADKLYGLVYGSDQTCLSYQIHRPVGVVAGIVGWNFPLLLAAQKVAPALAAGNCIVLKPSELTSLSASRLAELAVESGVPPGVFNVVHGAAAVGEALAAHSGVDLLTFTGSTRTGKLLLASAGRRNLKRLILECGGKAPNIVFADAPSLDAVAQAVVARAFWNQGQVCTASSRLLVERSIEEALIARVVARTSELVLGDPLSPEARFGALVSKAHKAKVLAYIDSGVKEGARLRYRGESIDPVPGGFYLAPVIFDRVSPQHTIAQEEIFGPVLSILSFADDDEAIRMANSTVYGLSAVAWTRDVSRAHALTQRLESGWITVNATEHPDGGPAEGVLTFGGHKDSGIGVEGGLEGLAAYTHKAAVQIFT